MYEEFLVFEQHAHLTVGKLWWQDFVTKLEMSRSVLGLNWVQSLEKALDQTELVKLVGAVKRIRSWSLDVNVTGSNSPTVCQITHLTAICWPGHAS